GRHGQARSRPAAGQHLASPPPDRNSAPFRSPCENADIFGMSLSPSAPPRAVIHSGVAQFSPAECRFLDALERRSLLYFIEQTDAHSGMTADRACADGVAAEAATSPASSAACGFALSAWCIAVERGWINRYEAIERVRRTLGFLLHD